MGRASWLAGLGERGGSVFCCGRCCLRFTYATPVSCQEIEDGHARTQANIGSNAQIEVWAKPLGGGRTAVLVVNTADKAAAAAATAAAAERARGSNQLNLVRARRFHLGIGPFWLRFTYATPVLVKKY
jgi:hypothetical protein